MKYPTCPPWCITDHGRIFEDTHRECGGPPASVPTRHGTLCVQPVRVVELDTGEPWPDTVCIGDEPLMPAAARQLVAQILDALATIEHGLADCRRMTGPQETN